MTDDTERCCYIVNVEEDSIIRYRKEWPHHYTGYDDVEITIATWFVDVNTD